MSRPKYTRQTCWARCGQRRIRVFFQAPQPLTDLVNPATHVQIFGMMHYKFWLWPNLKQEGWLDSWADRVAWLSGSSSTGSMCCSRRYEIYEPIINLKSQSVLPATGSRLHQMQILLLSDSLLDYVYMQQCQLHEFNVVMSTYKTQDKL